MTEQELRQVVFKLDGDGEPMTVDDYFWTLNRAQRRYVIQHHRKLDKLNLDILLNPKTR